MITRKTLSLSDLNPSEEQALKNYKNASSNLDGQSFCFDLNDKLRSGLWPDELGADFQSTVEALDSVFERCPRVEEEFTIFRGSGHTASFGPLKVGRCFRSLEFWSASDKEHVAINFVKSETSNSGIVLALSIPEGLPVYDMETLVGAGGHEHEFLLPRGILWRIEEIVPATVEDLPFPARSHFKSLGKMKLRPESASLRALK